MDSNRSQVKSTGTTTFWDMIIASITTLSSTTAAEEPGLKGDRDWSGSDNSKEEGRGENPDGINSAERNGLA